MNLESPESRLSDMNTGPGVCFIPGLQKEEQEAVDKRRPRVLEVLKNLKIQAKEAPVIAVLGSGGGLRAHIACLGVLSELKELGLLDAVTYLAGVSGSTWALSSFYTHNGNVASAEAELKRRFEQKEWHLKDSLERAIEAAKMDNYSLTDFWAYLVVSKQTRELQDSYLSSMKKHVEEGTLPYPIFAAIDGDLQPVWKKTKTQKTWFEFTPHHAGYPALGAYVPITDFGSKFEKGRLVKYEPERDLTFLRGLWGSALADAEEIKKYILNYIYRLRAEPKMGLHPVEGKETEAPMLMEKQQTQNVLSLETDANKAWTKVDEAVLELVIAYVEDPNDPGIQDKLQALQKVLGDERGECHELEHSWLAKMAQNWSEVSPGQREQFLEYLVYCFTRKSGPATYTPYTMQTWTRGTLWDIYTFLTKTSTCCWKWEWGTINNFLYEHGNITDEVMHSREFLHLVDAGFAINTAYPLVLPPTREVHLILSFDFSAGDPLETIRATADYCHRHGIPFPRVEEAKLQEWSRAPASCYILKGETGPVVMHFTLFNTDTCQGDIKKLAETYATIKLADTYTVDLVVDLLDMAKKNVRVNKDNILREISEVARKPRSFPRGNEEECLEVSCTAKEVQPSRTVVINISNRSDVTFKDPLLHLKYGQHHEALPQTLAPDSTISCSFVKKHSSFQGSMGLLVYQGPDFHLALMFSIPFSYAHYQIEFALAILTWPVPSNLKLVFDSIFQDKELQGLKVKKCVLQLPQGELELEHDSLIIRASLSNIHVAEMNVVIGNKAT
uniref:cytosolic phospholipase A2 gamma n=1 Tax=Jaculus jaculus TaxID=51337 RepID=UPI001E1B584F|nr:cytosolic phospholipase A2 gamma [Jaculus jaculus]XP_044990156.1 cytosolic phospholipase A2 gamma [Jaculus jaculus]XP_044990157.1 cytosolic phospholipase A2 gamma [Jaculus jaculus]